MKPAPNITVPALRKPSIAARRAAGRWAKVQALLNKGLSYRQAAERLGLTVGQIAGLKHRAKKAAEALT